MGVLTCFHLFFGSNGVCSGFVGFVIVSGVFSNANLRFNSLTWYVIYSIYSRPKTERNMKILLALAF